MTCPRCGSDGDVSKSPCSRCGLFVRVPGRTVVGREQPEPQRVSAEPLFPGVATGNVPFTPIPKTEVPETPGGLSWERPATARGGNTHAGQPKSVPNRPRGAASIDERRNVTGQQTPIRPGRPGNSGNRDELFSQSFTQEGTFSSSSTGTQQERFSAGFASASGITPGTLLRRGRYRIRELVERQEWQDGVVESTWIAQDAQRNNNQVHVRELIVPESGSMVMQSMVRTATQALSAVGRHPHLPALWDAFSEQGRYFFVFELVEGETLLARIHRTGRPLSEQDVIECCLQMIEILDLLSQQMPPVVHGLIQPEHIVIGSTGQFHLVNSSVILAGGATQFISGIDRARLSPYMSPEFARGLIDVRSDLYALIATAYHAATGSAPTITTTLGTATPAQRLNPAISNALDALLARGIRPIAAQRYQRPSELFQDLLTIRSVNGSVTQEADETSERANRPTAASNGTVAPAQDRPTRVSQDLAEDDVMERKLLLPRPEDLPPLSQRNDLQLSLIWLAVIILCLTLIVFMSQGFA